jgi:choline dehydrogenase-like flavoprotein
MKVAVEKAERQTYDLCIIGTGPAGIILALEYQKLQPTHQVLLIEYGTDGPASRNQLDDSIQVVESKNHHLPYECTNKGLGGSSASWGGRCVMYDEIDFMQRKILAGQCTWNIALFHESRTHANQSAAYFKCGDARFDLNEIPAFAGSRIAENFQNGTVTDSTIERYSLPTRFGPQYRAEINSAPAIHLLTGWEAFAFEMSPEDGTIAKVGIRDFTRSRRAKITARKIVLAAGAQETTRLLLKNRQVFNRQGGKPSALGKYYQGHVSGKIATIRFHGDPKKTNYGFLRTPDGVYLRRRFQLSKEALIENNLLNTALWLDNPLYVDPKHRNGAMSFMYLAMLTPGLGKRLAPPAVAHAITKSKIVGIPQHIGNILRDLPKSLTIPATTFYKRYCIKRKLPGVFLHSPQNIYALHFHAEQIPVQENRMELAEDGETLNIHYKIMDQDIDSIIRTHDVLDQWLRKCKCGELDYWFHKNEMAAAIRSTSMDGLHQVGTTRIAASADDGVVDGNLKVWGSPNLYVCSSSVFPTSGQANPTFLLGAFAVRLAHHLSSEKSR